METNYCRAQSEANDNKIINPTYFADVYVCMYVCAYPESLSARHGRVTAFAACKVHKVDPAGDAVFMLLSLHQLRLGKSAERKKS